MWSRVYIPPLVVPVNRVRVSCDIVHLSFPGPKDVLNSALSKRESESKDIRKSGTYKACRMMWSFSETVPICVEIIVKSLKPCRVDSIDDQKLQTTEALYIQFFVYSNRRFIRYAAVTSCIL